MGDLRPRVDGASPGAVALTDRERAWSLMFWEDVQKGRDPPDNRLRFHADGSAEGRAFIDLLGDLPPREEPARPTVVVRLPA